MSLEPSKFSGSATLLIRPSEDSKSKSVEKFLEVLTWFFKTSPDKTCKEKYLTFYLYRFRAVIAFKHNGDEKMDLNVLSLVELKKLQDEVAVAIFNYEKRKKAEALAAVEEAARAAGFSLKELLSDEKLSKGKTKAMPKYANPADPTQTWTGRGRKPKWVEGLLASGKSLDDAAI